jgi:hypothetical protein
MEFKARFPVHMPGLKIAGRSRPRNAIILRTTTIDIPHVETADAPLVLESKELIARSKFHAETYRLPPHYELREQFRTCGGKFFRRINVNVEQLEWGLKNGWFPLGPITAGFKAIEDKMPIGTFHPDGLKRLYPKGIAPVLNGLNSPDPDVGQALLETAELEVPASYADAIAKAEDDFKKRSAEMMICDGAVWVECQEPRLAVTFETKRCNIKLYSGTNDEARFFHEELESTHDISGTRMYFALSDIDKAKEFSKSLSRAFDVQVDALHLDVHDAMAFSKPSVIDNAIAAAQMFTSEKIDDYVFKLAKKAENNPDIDRQEVEMMLIRAMRTTYDASKRKALAMVLQEIQRDYELTQDHEALEPQSLTM